MCLDIVVGRTVLTDITRMVKYFTAVRHKSKNGTTRASKMDCLIYTGGNVSDELSTEVEEPRSELKRPAVRWTAIDRPSPVRENSEVLLDDRQFCPLLYNN